VRRREAALRAQGEPIERDDRGRFADPRLQVFPRFHARQLRADEAQDHHAALGDEAERRECARALVVVLEQEPIELRATEDLLCDPVVAAGRVEHALVVTAADVNAERDARVALDDRVVELHRRREQRVRVAAALAVTLADRLVEERRVLRRVDLDVLAAESFELRDLATGEIDEVGEIGVPRRIRAARLVRVVIGRRLLRAEERHLGRHRGAAAQVGEFLDRHLAAPLQFLDDDRTLQRRFMPLAVAEGDRPARVLVESLERLDQVAVERVATHLTVGHDVEPRLLLHRDGLVDGAILHLFAGSGRQLAAFQLRVRGAEIVRTEEGTDDVAAEIHGTDGSALRGAVRDSTRFRLSASRAMESV
jgi:hypothetical protein